MSDLNVHTCVKPALVARNRACPAQRHSTMISAVAWVPRGAAKAVPVVHEPTEEEMAAAREMAEAHRRDGGNDEEQDDAEQEDAQSSDNDEDTMQDDEQRQAAAKARAAAAAMTSSGRSAAGPSGRSLPTDSIEAAMRELDMEHYDDSDEENVMSKLLCGKADVALDVDGDPYITLDEDSEDEDFTIKPTDLLILAAKNEDDVSNLEIWVYEEADSSGEGNLYVHHDILLPAFPLCIAWLDCSPDGSVERANIAAVGGMEPGIEIWDLDVVDTVEPAASLGGEAPVEAAAASSSEAGKKKKKKKSKPQAPTLREGSHQDSVLGLSWNQQYRNVLASASADKTVKVWDVSRQVCEHTLHHHTGKVQAVAWNPAEAPVLLSGAFDRSACLVDVRAPSTEVPRWRVTADVEALTWHPHQPTCFLVSSEDGIVACYDARKGAGSASVFCLSAHDAPTCTMSFSTAAPGLLATGSTDKKVKLWDVSNHTPSLIASKDLQVGAVFSASFCGQAGYLLACAGAMGSVTVWDMRSLKAATSHWPQLKQMGLQPDALPAADEDD